MRVFVCVCPCIRVSAYPCGVLHWFPLSFSPFWYPSMLNPSSPIPRLLSHFHLFQVQVEGESKPFVRNIFTLGTCAPIAGSKVIACKTEVQMLEAWSAFVREADPDIITGAVKALLQ